MGIIQLPERNRAHGTWSNRSRRRQLYIGFRIITSAERVEAMRHGTCVWTPSSSLSERMDPSSSGFNFGLSQMLDYAKLWLQPDVVLYWREESWEPSRRVTLFYRQSGLTNWTCIGISGSSVNAYSLARPAQNATLWLGGVQYLSTTVTYHCSRDSEEKIVPPHLWRSPHITDAPPMFQLFGIETTVAIFINSSWPSQKFIPVPSCIFVRRKLIRVAHELYSAEHPF